MDRITQRGFRYVFRPHANDTLKAHALVEGIMSLAAKHGGLKSGVILSENTEWGKSVADKQKTFLQQAGVDIKLVEHYPYAAPDLTSMIVKTRALRPDLVLANSYLGDALADHSADGRIPTSSPTVYAAGGGGHLQPDFVKRCRRTRRGRDLRHAWDPAVGRKRTLDQGDQRSPYRAHGVPITEDAGCYYQCFQVLVDALERSQGARSEEDP